MKLIPNPYDTRIRKKFKDVLNVTEKDVRSYLDKLEDTAEDQYVTVTPEMIENNGKEQNEPESAENSSSDTTLE